MCKERDIGYLRNMVSKRKYIIMDLFFLTNVNKVPQRAQLNNNLATNLNRISRCSRELLCHPYLCLFFFNLWWLLLASWDSSLCACGRFRQVRPWLGFCADQAAEPRLSHPILTKLCSGSSGLAEPCHSHFAVTLRCDKLGAALPAPALPPHP